MKLELTQTVALVGKEIFAHLETSSVFALVLTSSSTFTWSPLFSRAITSLFTAACARTLTFGWLTTAGPGATTAGLIGSAVAVDFFGEAAGFFATAAFFFFAGCSEFAGGV